MEKQKKVLIFSDCFVYSGSELVIENILLSHKMQSRFEFEFIYGSNPTYDRRLKERFEVLGLNHENVKAINLIHPVWAGFQKSLQKKNSINYYYFLIKTLMLRLVKYLFVSHILNFFTLRKNMLKSKPDILYINNGGYPASLQCILAVFVAKSIGIKTIFFNINNMAMERTKWYEKYIDSYMNRSVTKFITASYAAQEQAVEIRNLKKDSFVRIPNTIYKDKQIDFQKKNFEGRKQIKFGSVGLLTQRKGYHILIKAVDILVNQHKVTDFQIEIIGDGEEKQNLQELATKYNINSYVQFLGFKSNPYLYIRDFDVFILPSVRNEDFPYVILEAMIFAKPIIGTYVAGIPEQIEDQETGLLIEPNNPVQLANAMREMLNLKKIEQYGLKSREKYFYEFKYDLIEEKYFELFNSIFH
jgi:glycosyltransferase involved in cell wall biosynthesis